MAGYLQQVLHGDLPLPDVMAWLTQPDSLPPAPLTVDPASPSSPSTLGCLDNLTPDLFRVLVLNCVKEEAEAVFAAAEQQAAAAHQRAAASSKALRASRQKPTAPGAVSDMAFPALPVQAHKVILHRCPCEADSLLSETVSPSAGHHPSLVHAEGSSG